MPCESAYYEIYKADISGYTVTGIQCKQPRWEATHTNAAHIQCMTNLQTILSFYNTMHVSHYKLYKSDMV